MTTQVQLTTADELLRLLRGRVRYELVRGDLRTLALEGHEHGMLAAEFATRLWKVVRANKLGKVYAAGTGFKLATEPDTVRAPDAAFISQKRLDEVGPVQGYWPGAPDLSVEVVSPNDLYTEVSDKVAEWLQAGSRMVMVVNPRRQQVFVHAPHADVKVMEIDDTLDGGDVVPGGQRPAQTQPCSGMHGGPASAGIYRTSPSLWPGITSARQWLQGKPAHARLSVAHKTLLALLPDRAVLTVLSTVVRLARSPALGVVSDAKPGQRGASAWMLRRSNSFAPPWRRLDAAARPA